MSFSETLAQLVSKDERFDVRPVIKQLVDRAETLGASDIHLSPLSDKVELVFRIDGVLRHECDLPSASHQRLVVGLKNMAKMLSYKHSLPQDGSFQLSGLNLRAATIPTLHGERVVIRILRNIHQAEVLDSLGFEQTELQVLESLIDRAQGLFLATGPAGSGKTTSLLSLMVRLVELRKARATNDPSYRCSVMTLEDPVEYVVPGFQQTSIQAKIGLGFGEGLRSILRQDPEIILVGEIRDLETASTVVQAALSGHMVLSSLHALDTVGVIPRLLDLGVEPYQLAAALTGILSQRLVRTLCNRCKEKSGEHFQALGCDECHHSGYRGRQVIPEILSVDEGLRDLILQKASLSEMRASTQTQGLKSLWKSGLARVERGETSLQEVERIVPRA